MFTNHPSHVKIGYNFIKMASKCYTDSKNVNLPSKQIFLLYIGMAKSKTYLFVLNLIVLVGWFILLFY